MSASLLAKTFSGAVRVTVVEPPRRTPSAAEFEIESMPATLQSAFFDLLGIPEGVWMQASCASFTSGVRYVNWRTDGFPDSVPRMMRNGNMDQFYRSFGKLPELNRFHLSDYWQLRRWKGESAEPFDHACLREPPLMDARKSPRWMDGRKAIDYGWHVDSRMFTAYLRRIAVQDLGVTVVRGELSHADRDDRGMLTALHTREGQTIPGDLFLDCTGQERRLLAGVLGEPFEDESDRLLCDSVVTATVPHDDLAYGIEPYSTAVAMPAGWAWRMPLPGRCATGYAYSSDGTEPTEAARDLLALWGPTSPTGATGARHSTVRHLRRQAGRSRRSWVRNCVAIGAASYVLEPFETQGTDGTDSTVGANGTGAVLRALDLLVRHFPGKAALDAPAARFNRAIASGYARARDFGQLHYAAAPRTDTPFWKAQEPLPRSASLAELLDAYRTGLPFPAADAQHYALLAALIAGPVEPPPALARLPQAVRAADALFERVRRQQRVFLETLPSAHAYLDRLHRRRWPDLPPQERPTTAQPPALSSGLAR